MALHILKGNGPPTSITPVECGMHYIDVLNGDAYISVGTTSPADWVLSGGTGTSFTTLLSLLDTPGSYAGSAGLPITVSDDELGVDFGSLNVGDLTDVNTAGIQDVEILEWDQGTGEFIPKHRMEWLGLWSQGSYKKSQVVNDLGWTMIANVETSDRAAPQPDAESAFSLPDNPSWTDSTVNPLAVQGVRFEVIQTVAMDGFRFWIPQQTGDESYFFYVFDISDPAKPLTLGSGQIPPTTPVGWSPRFIPNVFFAPGTVLDIQFITVVTNANTAWTHTWTLQDNIGGVPASGTYTRSADFTLLRINEMADGPTDVSTDLDLLKDGDELVFFEFANASRFNTYLVSGTVTKSNGDTVYEVPVQRVANGQEVRTGTLVQSDATIHAGFLPAPINYLPNFWFLNDPVNVVNIKGYVKTNLGDSPSLNDNAYGIDVSGNGYIESPDWDIITTTLGGSSGGGGGGGSTSFLGLVDTPASYVGNENKLVAVNAGGTALEFTITTGGVTSFETRQGDVVGQTGDYSALQVGAYDIAETDAAITDAIENHELAQDPHPQYVLPSDLPSLSIFYFTGLTSTIDGAYLQLVDAPLGNAANTVAATTAAVDTPELIGQWLGETPEIEDTVFLATGSFVTLDLTASEEFLDCQIDIGVRRVGGTFEVLGIGTLITSTGRNTYTLEIAIPETNLFTGDTGLLRAYLVKKPAASGGNKTMTIHMEGDYVTRTLTNLPGASTPLPHATTHEVAGSDQINHDLLLNANGFDSHATIDTKTADYESRLSVNEPDIESLQGTTTPDYGLADGRMLYLTTDGLATWAITTPGSYNVNGTFRFTQQSSSGSGQGAYGDAVISGLVLTSLTLRNTGSAYVVGNTITLDIPDASENVAAVITVSTTGFGKKWNAPPLSGVTTVFGRSGDVVATLNDYNADLIDDASTTNKWSSQVEIDQLATNTGDISTNVTNIGTNTTDIGTNTTDISTHIADLDNPHETGELLLVNIADTDSPVTGVIGVHYLTDTTAGTIVINLPDLSSLTTLEKERGYIAVSDTSNTWGTNTVTLHPFSGDSIDDAVTDEDLILDVQSQNIQVNRFSDTQWGLDTSFQPLPENASVGGYSVVSNYILNPDAEVNATDGVDKTNTAGSFSVAQTIVADELAEEGIKTTAFKTSGDGSVVAGDYILWQIPVTGIADADEMMGKGIVKLKVISGTVLGDWEFQVYNRTTLTYVGERIGATASQTLTMAVPLTATDELEMHQIAMKTGPTSVLGLSGIGILPQTKLTSAIAEDWEPWTGTFTNFNPGTTFFSRQRRVAGSYEVELCYADDTASAGQTEVNMPAGLTIDAADNSVIAMGTYHDTANGQHTILTGRYRASVNDIVLYTQIVSGASLVSASFAGSGVTGTRKVEIKFIVAIVGWNNSMPMATDAQFANARGSFNESSGQAIPHATWTTLTIADPIKDETQGQWDGTTWTAARTGFLEGSFSILWANSFNNNSSLRIQINGGASRKQVAIGESSGVNSIPLSFSDLYLEAGDTAEFQVYQTETVSRSITTDSSYVWLDLNWQSDVSAKAYGMPFATDDLHGIEKSIKVLFSQGSTTVPDTTVTTNMTSLLLTPGTWDLTASMDNSTSTNSNANATSCGIDVASGVFGTFGINYSRAYANNLGGTQLESQCRPPPQVVTVTTDTTYYLNGRVDGSGGLNIPTNYTFMAKRLST